VGNGTNGTANAVYFQAFSGGTPTLLAAGLDHSAGFGGQVAILASDPDVGAVYVKDVERHFARKVIKRMWIHVDSLQPATSNNMMVAIGVSRGPGGAAISVMEPLATAPLLPNSVSNVLSMKRSFTVDSWEHTTVEISDCIAGGSGPRQNEFEIQGQFGGGAFYTPSAAPVTPAIGLVPACFAVAGNSTTAGLENTKVHQITFEQEVDLLDFIGGMDNQDAEN